MTPTGTVARFVLPCYMMIGNKRISLNLNWYRNAHFQLLNKVKQAFWPLESVQFRADRIEITYTLVWNNRRRTDRMNWIAVADKFFLDWLVERGYMVDDDLTRYSSTTARQIIDPDAAESHIVAEVTIF